MNPKVDAYLKKAGKWREEMGKLRSIILGTGLTEDMKWGHPCYTLGEGNVVLIHGFKDYCAVLFFKGALLKDPGGILVQQTANVQAARQIRFTNTQEIAQRKAALEACLAEAIAAEKAGLKVQYKKTADFGVPAEFRNKLDELPALKKAFAALTPGRQRAYILHFSSAKQSKTRESRIEKCLPRIMEGKGMDD